MRNIYYNKPTEWLELSVDDTPQANLRIGTISGLPYFVDWGDGVVEVYTSLQTITKVYTTNYTGVVRIATPMGLGDIRRIEVIDNLSKYNFDATDLNKCVNLDILYLIGTGLTGNMSGVSNFTSLTYLRLQSSLFTGDMSGASQLPLVNYFYILGDFTINYTSTTFAPNFQRWGFRPTTATNPMSSTEIDQMLIDASQTTWSGEKAIYADGNNGVRTSASDAAVLTLQGMGVTLYLNI